MTNNWEAVMNNIKNMMIKSGENSVADWILAFDPTCCVELGICIFRKSDLDWTTEVKKVENWKENNKEIIKWIEWVESDKEDGEKLQVLLQANDWNFWWDYENNPKHRKVYESRKNRLDASSKLREHNKHFEEMVKNLEDCLKKRGINYEKIDQKSLNELLGTHTKKFAKKTIVKYLNNKYTVWESRNGEHVKVEHKRKYRMHPLLSRLIRINKETGEYNLSDMKFMVRFWVASKNANSLDASLLFHEKIKNG